MPEVMTPPEPVRKKRARIQRPVGSSDNNTSRNKLDSMSYNRHERSEPERRMDEYDERKGHTLRIMSALIEDYKLRIKLASEKKKDIDYETIERLNVTVERLSNVDRELYNKVKYKFRDFSINKNIDNLNQLHEIVQKELDKEDFKKINNIAMSIANGSKEFNEDDLKNILRTKSTATLAVYKTMAMDRYKKERTEHNFKKLNLILEPMGGGFVRKEKVKISLDERKASRYAFDGYMYVPSEYGIDSGKSGYSKAYSDFLKEDRQDMSPQGYDISKFKAWQTLKSALEVVDIDMPDEKILVALAKIKMPKKYVETLSADDKTSKLNVTDIARILFDEYAHGPMNNKAGSANLDFNKILNSGGENIFDARGVKPGVNDCSNENGLNRKFFKEHFLKDKSAKEAIRKDLISHGVSPQYIDERLFPSIEKDGIANPKIIEGQYPGVIPMITVHHKEKLEDVGIKGNLMTNFMAIPVFPNEIDEHELRHKPDENKIKDSDRSETILLVKNENKSAANQADYVQLRPGEDPRGRTVYVERYVELYDKNSNDGNTLIYSSGSRSENNVMADVRLEKQDDDIFATLKKSKEKE